MLHWNALAFIWRTTLFNEIRLAGVKCTILTSEWNSIQSKKTMRKCVVWFIFMKNMFTPLKTAFFVHNRRAGTGGASVSPHQLKWDFYDFSFIKVNHVIRRTLNSKWENSGLYQLLLWTNKNVSFDVAPGKSTKVCSETNSDSRRLPWPWQ